MTPERWHKVTAMFHAALEQPSSALEEFLRRECGDDAQLYDEVRGMVEQHARSGILDHAPVEPAGAQAVFAAGEMVSGRYRILRFLGRGGMGEVYEAEDLDLQERVALKTLLPEIAGDGRMIARFKQEIQLSRKISHPNVCRVFDLARHPADGSASQAIFFLTMELLAGETLAARLHREHRLAPAAALPLLSQMAEALAAAHRAGVIHRDFKPSNVMLVPSASGVRAVVTDFGLARSLAGSGETTATLTGKLMGTLDYMAPELLTGSAASVSSDVYALGMVAYKMVTGDLPFAAETPLAAAILRSKVPVPPPRAINPAIDQTLNRAIIRALDPTPTKRFSTVLEFAQGLRRETAPVAVAMPRVLRTRFALSVAVLILLTMVLLSSWFLLQPSVTLPTMKSTAVLPFTNIGNTSGDQAFGEGLVESLIGRLSQIERFDDSFTVVPSSEFAGIAIKQPSAARRSFGVNLVITGSIDYTDNKLRMVINLVNASTSRQLASRTVEDPVGHSSRLLDQAFDNLVDMLNLRLSADARRGIIAGGTSSATAFDACERGIGMIRRAGVPQLDEAIGLFQNALRQDSGYALAYAGLGEAYAFKYGITNDPELARQARVNGERAVALSDSLASVHLALGQVEFRTGHFDDALREFHRTLEVDPTGYYVYHWLGRTLEALGRIADAEQAYISVIRMRPSYWLGHTGLGAFYYRHGQYAKAEPYLRKSIEFAPDNPTTYASLGGVYLAMGLYDAAEAVLKQSLAIKETYGACSNLGASYLMRRRYEDAAAILEKAATLNPNDPRVWRNLGDAYRFGNHPAQAISCFRRAVELVDKELSVNPADTQALANLALYQAKLGDSLKAQEAIRRALAGKDADSEIRFKASIVYALAGNRPAAWRELRAALDGGFSREEVRTEPELASLRQDPRFISLLEGDHR